MPVIEFPPFEGYPTDYLVARICGRRSLMLRNWEALLMTPKPALPAKYAERGVGGSEEAVARALRWELWWVARQMDGWLREIFHPVYIYFELGTIFTCIRYKALKETEEAVEIILAKSIISPALKESIRRADSQAAAMEIAVEAFRARSEAYRGIARARRPADAEQRLTDTFLKEAAANAPHPVIRGFFRIVIDMRNLISAYKRLRWGIEIAPPLIEGGNIEISRLKGIASEAALISAARRLTGLAAKRPSDVEGLFLRRLLVYSKEAARGVGAVGVVLDYLLRCHNEARNLGLILTGQTLDRELLRSELVS